MSPPWCLKDDKVIHYLFSGKICFSLYIWAIHIPWIGNEVRRRVQCFFFGRKMPPLCLFIIILHSKINYSIFKLYFVPLKTFIKQSIIDCMLRNTIKYKKIERKYYSLTNITVLLAYSMMWSITIFCYNRRPPFSCRSVTNSRSSSRTGSSYIIIIAIQQATRLFHTFSLCEKGMRHFIRLYI